MNIGLMFYRAFTRRFRKRARDLMRSAEVLQGLFELRKLIFEMKLNRYIFNAFLSIGRMTATYLQSHRVDKHAVIYTHYRKVYVSLNYLRPKIPHFNAQHVYSS